jgi:hypothetical protein
MRDLTKYMQERDKRKRMGMFLTDLSLEEAMRQGKMLSNNELARIWSDRSGYEISPMSLGAWLNANRLPEGDNKRALVNAVGLEIYAILEEPYFEAKYELTQEIEKEIPFMLPEDMQALRNIIERIRERRNAYGRNHKDTGGLTNNV